MFRANESHQIGMDDSFLVLPEYIKGILEKSWAKDFADFVFPAINEGRFSALYSEKDSRPNTPINVIIGSMLLKEYFDFTEEELLMQIYCNVQFQYALCITQCAKPPVSDRTWSRFRERLSEYEKKTGIDLFKTEMESLSIAMAQSMGLNSNLKRMDSLMVASHSKWMSRLEIIYSVNANAIRLLNRLGVMDYFPQGCAHYMDEDDQNNVIYRSKGSELSGRLQHAIDEAMAIKKALEETEQTESREYQQIVRVLDDQTIEKEGKVIPRESKDISPESLQAPSDPDATFRHKAGEEYKGFVGNVVETVAPNGLGIVTNMDLQPNVYSDSQFCRDYINAHDENSPQETMLTDGAYGGCENVKKAAEKGIDLVTTALTGRLPDPIMASFQLSEDGTHVIKCPYGYSPEKCTYQPQTGMCRVKFPRGCCENCPNKDHCGMHEQKKSFVTYVSVKTVERASFLKKMSTEKYKKLSRIRNGIESRPSLLRRRLNVDSIPVFGLQKVRQFFYAKTVASNLIALFGFCKRRRGKSAIFA